MARRPLRIGITGSAGTGKTKLAEALASELDLPLIGEEIRAWMLSETNAAQRTRLDERPRSERREVLEALFSDRIETERALESFVADNTCLDFTAYALHHGIYDEFASVEEAPLLTLPARSIGGYDAVFVLPHGALPYERDGVRTDSPLGELRYHHLLADVLRSSFATHRIHAVPTHLKNLRERVRHVRLVLERAGLLESPRPLGPRPDVGTVYLVGAGPGDPALLTVRARELLEQTDVVAPDKLVPPELLESLPQGVEILQVGHRGRGSRTADHRIHPAVVHAALQGKHVVRLKAGDPMIFGRGAEEAEELRAAGIPFEIVPGVSAALGAAAYAGIPLTHRDHSSDVTFATGHASSSARPSRTLWNGLGAGSGTIVLYMAAQRLEQSLTQLVEAGRPPSTPAAYIAGATHVSQRVIVGTLANLAQLARDEDRSRPALVVIGDVVQQRSTTAWLEARRPLLGRSALVARARSGSSRIATQLRELGARVVESPIVEDVALHRIRDLEAALSEDVLALVIGDRAAGLHLRALAAGLSPELRSRLYALPCVALTEAAASDIAELGLPLAATADGSCDDAVGVAIREALGERRGPVLIPCETRGRDHLQDTLRRLDMQPLEVVVFERYHRFPRGAFGTFDVAIYPGSSSVRAVFADELAGSLRDVPSVSIGPLTTDELHRNGVRFIEQAEEDTVSSTLETALRVLTAPSIEQSLPR